MANGNWRLVVVGALATAGLVGVTWHGRADEGMSCTRMMYGCPFNDGKPSGPSCGDEGCIDPPVPWNPQTTSCEMVEVLTYYECEKGRGDCKKVQVNCATVQSYGGGVCKEGSCDTSYPAGDPYQIKTEGCQ